MKQSTIWMLCKSVRIIFDRIKPVAISLWHELQTIKGDALESYIEELRIARDKEWSKAKEVCRCGKTLRFRWFLWRTKRKERKYLEASNAYHLPKSPHYDGAYGIPGNEIVKFSMRAVEARKLPAPISEGETGSNGGATTFVSVLCKNNETGESRILWRDNEGNLFYPAN